MLRFRPRQETSQGSWGGTRNDLPAQKGMAGTSPVPIGKAGVLRDLSSLSTSEAKKQRVTLPRAIPGRNIHPLTFYLACAVAFYLTFVYILTNTEWHTYTQSMWHGIWYSLGLFDIILIIPDVLFFGILSYFFPGMRSAILSTLKFWFLQHTLCNSIWFSF